MAQTLSRAASGRRARRLRRTAGAGVEVAATENMSVDLQYRYSDYGKADYSLPTDDATLGLTNHALTAGVNFRF